MNANQVKCWFLRRGETGVPGENLSVQIKNQQTQPTYDAGSGNRTRVTLVGGECSPLRHPCTQKAEGRVFLTDFEVVGYLMKHSFECLILLLKGISILKRYLGSKLAKFYAD